MPTWRFSHVHIDSLGTLPSSHGFSYLLNMIDWTTCWQEVVPYPSISVKSCLRAFLATWVSRFGVPWPEFALPLGSQPLQQPAFTLSNRLIDCFHCSLKSALGSCLAGSEWLRHLPLVLLGLRTAPKDNTGLSNVHLRGCLWCSSQLSWGVLRYPHLLFFTRSRMLLPGLVFLHLTMCVSLRLTSFHQP